jgi:hypothetical protein
MKNSYACFFFILFFLYRSQTNPVDTLKVEIKRKYPLFEIKAEKFPTDSLPSDAMPTTFHWLGLQGLNQPLYEFRPQIPSVQWRWNSSVFIHQQDFIPFFLISPRPYVLMKGTAGSRQWQDFKGIFSFPAFRGKGQNTIYLNRYGGPGFYNKQQTFINDLMTTSFFENSSFSYEFHLFHRRQKFQENGGLLSDTMSLQQELSPKEFLPVKFYGANVRNSVWNANLEVYKVIRSSSSDSAVRNKWLAGFQSSFNKETYQYLHDNPKAAGFYTLYYLDTLKTNDSIAHVEFSLGPSFKIIQKNRTHLLYYNYAFGKIRQFSDSLYQYGFAGFQSRFSGKHWNTSFFGKYLLHGFWQGNFAAGANVGYVFKFLRLEHDIDMLVSVERRFPDWIFIRQYGNHFQWQITPERQLVYQSGVKIQSLYYELGAWWSSTRNMYVWDERAFPLLIRGPVMNYRAFAGVKIKWGVWKNEVRFIFQGTSHPQAVRMPSYLTDVRTCFDFRMFSKNLWMQTGLDMRYIPGFIPYAYMPNMQVFYLKDLKPVNEYVWLSPFISAKVNPARFYVKAENILYWILNKTPGWVYQYKQPGFWIHAGVMWEFRD